MSETAEAVVTETAPADGAVVVSDTTVASTTEAAAAPAATTTPEPVKAEPVVYDLKLPDGSPLDPSALERTVAIARERGLSAEQAQAMVNVAHEEASSVLAAHLPNGEKWKAQISAWEAAALADPELGAGKPEQLAQKVAAAKAALDRFAEPAFVKMLFETGYGSRPEVLKIFSKIAAAAAEPAFSMGGTHSPSGADALKQMYPTMYQH